MLRALFRFLFNTLRLFVRTMNLLVRGVFYAVLLFGIGALVAMMFAKPAELSADSALLLRPSGVLVEQAAVPEALDLLGDSEANGHVLSDLTLALRLARDDERISALVLETDELLGGGFAKLAELRAAIVDFKRSGKPVIARGERFTQAQYYLASAADEIHLSPDGFVLLGGLARYSAYFKDALDRLGVKVHVFRAGEYKSFAEPFTRNDMSPEDRAAALDLLNGLWGQLRAEIASGRKLAEAAVDRYVDGYPDLLIEVAGDAALAAREAGLVDQLSSRDQWRQLVRKQTGREDEAADAGVVGVLEYLALASPQPSAAAEQIAVIVGQGTIVDGREAVGVMGGDAYAQLLRQVRNDEAVKAVVLRLDSPGGSAWASELIRRELELTRAAGKPVIVSMSSVAASGAYWIASAADEIWASPATLTGSIGVFGIFPEIAQPLKELGIHVDGVATSSLAAALDPRRPLSAEAAQTLQLGVDHAYRRFIDIVARGRGMEASDVDAVARGRVWLGAAAQQLGLVDQLGGLDDALAAAAERAELEDYEVVWPEPGIGLRERLLRKLGSLELRLAGWLPAAWSDWLGWAGWAGWAGSAGTERSTTSTRNWFAHYRDAARLPAASLLDWNDPRHLYLHCLCEAP